MLGADSMWQVIIDMFTQICFDIIFLKRTREVFITKPLKAIEKVARWHYAVVDVGTFASPPRRLNFVTIECLRRKVQILATTRIRLDGDTVVLH